MAVNLTESTDLSKVPGIQLGTTHAGIRYKNRKDLLVISAVESTRFAAVFTRNRFRAAPVIVAQEHMDAGGIRACVINSGNANAGTGSEGIAAARESCRAVASALQIDEAGVLPFSTGVIGQPLPVDKIVQAVPDAVSHLSEDGWLDAAKAIMTTDTVAKGVSRQIAVRGKTVTITGICKGSGMIRPDMATMLAYIGTDAAVAPDLLQTTLEQLNETSFNCITVDGDTSTNDACILMATGKCELPEWTTEQDEGFAEWRQSLLEVMMVLAQAIVRDAEGATKFVTVQVRGAESEADAREVAFTVAHSPLVKTALFASDPNWGRILAAVGRAQVNDLDVDRIDINIGDVCVLKAGAVSEEYKEASGQEVMNQDEIVILIDLNLGSKTAIVWTSDLSHEYIRINAEYRS